MKLDKFKFICINCNNVPKTTTTTANVNNNEITVILHCNTCKSSEIILDSRDNTGAKQ